MSSKLSHQVDQRRKKVVEEHLRCENAHDLEGIMATFGDAAHYEEMPWEDRYKGRQAVRAYYQNLLQVLPDLTIEAQRAHTADETIVLEVMIRGTHSGTWRGLPATGREVEFPLCAIYTFDEQDRLAGERIYYDRMMVLEQVGLYRDPATVLGRLTTILNHPLILVRAGMSALTSRIKPGRRVPTVVLI